jgi:hypothetical protein
MCKLDDSNSSLQHTSTSLIVHMSWAKKYFTRIAEVKKRVKLAAAVHLHTHVDDGNCIGPPGPPQQAVKEILKVFPSCDLGLVKKSLDIEVERDATSSIIAINQQKLIRDKLARFNLPDGYPAKTPMVSRWSLPLNDPLLLSDDASRYRSMVGAVSNPERVRLYSIPGCSLG